MKLRQLPEDFKVEEISHFNILDKGSYKLYLLEKKSLESFSMLKYLSRENNIPFSELGIAGLKDRHAVTKQYLTIPAKYGLKTSQENSPKISFLGYVEKKIKSGDLEGNKFQITVRDIKKGELDGIKQKAENLRLFGVPNYFDSQRFGSVINREFMARFLIKKDYEAAVKIYLTSFSKFESSRIKQEKRWILQNWGSLSRLRVKNPSFAEVINGYRKNQSWLEAYKKIPANLREIFVFAYQSYLWNECIKEVLKCKVSKKKRYAVEYNIGSLVFYKALSEEEQKSLPKIFKTVSDQMKPTSFEAEIIGKVLAREEIKPEDFNIKEQTGNFFKTHEREVLVKPEQFKISEPLLDELNGRGRDNCFKMVLEFVLPKGSYATVITKRIFGH